MKCDRTVAGWAYCPPPMLATRLNATMAAVHSAYELAGGVALPAQDIVGLPAAVGIHAAIVGAAFAAPPPAAGRRGRIRAILNGVGVAGTLAHFLGWRTERRAGVFPVLAGRAEGLTPAWTRWYTPVLYGWGVASVAAVVADTDPQDRPWARAAAATAPLIALAGRRKERWAAAQAAIAPRWWNWALSR